MSNYETEMGQETQEMNQENFEFEWENNEMQEYSNEMGNEYQGESQHEMQGEMNEVLEMELATELLGVQNEAQLEQFLGSLIKRAAGAVKSFAKSSAGRAVGGFLKKAAKTALPWAGRALGTALGGPVGGMIGGKLASAASNLFELELEGLSNEDREFEIARAYVRFASDAARRAARNPRSRYNPYQTARRSIYDAARRWAPGFIRRPSGTYSSYNSYDNFGGSNNGSGYDGYSDTQDDYEISRPPSGPPNMGPKKARTGTWVRRGRQIIINL